MRKQFISLILIFLYFPLAFGAFEAYMDEETNRKLSIRNPSESLTDILQIDLETDGNINAFFEDSRENRMTITLQPMEKRSIPVIVIGSICTEIQCEGTLTIKAESTKTGNLVSEDFDFIIFPEKGQKLIGSAPDISLMHLFLIGLIGSVIFFAMRKN